MRVLIAPDKFAGTLTAVEAAEAIAEGWRRRAPEDELDLCPMADGGPGFVDVLHASLGGELFAVTVSGLDGAQVPATLLRVGETTYAESAQVCGIELLRADPELASTFGIGELIRHAVASGASRVVVGLGGSGTIDGGAGMLATLGATADVPLDIGAIGLEGITTFTPATPPEVALVAATDVDIPLTGLFGAVKTFGPLQGMTEKRQPAVDATLERFAEVVDRRTALVKGAGAAGGLGYGLLVLGAERVEGIATVAEAVALAHRARQADLVITGEGAFDFSSRSGKVPYGVAEVAAEALRPCIALAGQVHVGAREMRALGIESAYSLTDLVGARRALSDPAGSLAELAERTARTWSR